MHYCIQKRLPRGWLDGNASLSTLFVFSKQRFAVFVVLREPEAEMDKRRFPE